MRSTKTLPILFPSGPTNAAAQSGLWCAMLDRLPHILALIRGLIRAATDHRRMSADTLRDLGLIWGEHPYAGAADHYRMDCRL